METEIKLRFLEPNGKEQILSNKWIRSLEMPDSLTVKTLKNIYYDTKDHVLEKNKAVFRVRDDGDETYVSTVKIAKSVSEGLHQRLEWSVDQDFDSVDIKYFRKMAESDGDPDEILSNLLDMLQEQELVEVCSTEFERTTIHLGYEDTLIELACDNGYYKSGKKEQPFSELELELIEGDTRALLNLAEEIEKIVKVEPENMSKYGRCIEMSKRNKK